jgi:ABC-type glycerol-3-phosphate transport system substrate-binding protein
VEPPETWDALLESAGTLQAYGVPAYSIGGADGWTLTDLFENIYLRTAGPELYDQLSNHEIPWTDESVITALERMAEIIGDEQNLAGGTSGSLQTDFPTSVTRVFADEPEAAMVIEGDFVGTTIAESTNAEPETGFNVFTFPSIDDSAPAVMGGGDAVVLFTENEAAKALLEYLATPEAAEIWAAQGGFSSPNQNLDPGVYPDEITRATASALAEAETFRFDLSDLQPSEFGGTVGQGLFKLFQDFLRNPDDAAGIAEQMERAASRAFG